METCCRFLRGRSCLVMLVVLLSAGLVRSVSFGKDHFFSMVQMEEAGCLPEDFEQRLPHSLWVNAMTCRHQRVAGERPSTTEYLHCLANKLELVDGSGVVMTAVGRFLDSLPADSSFSARWKSGAAACLSDTPSALSAARQAVFLLSCLRQRIALPCIAGTGRLCLASKFYTPLRLSETLPGFRLVSARRRCPREMSAFRLIPDSGGSARDDLCSQLLQHVQELGVCLMTADGQASGQTVNRTLVREAVLQLPNTGGEYGVSQRLSVLEKCDDETLDDFLSCWVAHAPVMSINLISQSLAMTLES